FTIISNPLFDEFYGPFIPIYIFEEERTRREHADYINRMEMLFTINPCPHNLTNDNTNAESFSSFLNQENKPRQEEIDVFSITNDVLPPSNDDSDEEVDVVGDLRVDNVIQNSEHEYSESEDSDLNNPLLPLPSPEPPEPPDKEFYFEIDFQKEISVRRNAIVKFNAKVKFGVFNDENDVLSYFMFFIFSKEFSLLSAESEDTIFDPEHDKATQKLDILKLKARVKRLERANKVKSSKLRRLRKVGASRRIESSDDMEDVFNQGRMIEDLDKDEGIELVKDADSAETKGRHAAEQAENKAEIYHLDLNHPFKVLISAASATISAAKPSIPAAAPTVVAAYTRRRKGVIIRDPEKELSLKTPAETPKLKDKSKGLLVETPKPMKKKDQIELDAEFARKLHEEINKDHEEINKDIDWDASIDHVNQKSKNPQYIKRYQGMKKRPQSESEARKNMMIYLKNTAGYTMDFFKGMSYDEICPIFQARFDENMRFRFKSKEEMEEEDQEVLKRINETPAQKAAKRRKLNEEAQEAEDLKKCLEVVDDEDDDVFIEATPLARKVHIVDYQIVLIDNKPRFKIIRADETYQLYISFITLLKNIDREDLENL
nr:hypothetical protein [Tanacetum cinerariifolium]